MNENALHAGEEAVNGSVREDLRDDRTNTVRVYVNERGVTIPAGATALDAVRALFPSDAEDVERGKAQLADSRGLPTDALQVATSGSIFRVIGVRQRHEGAS